MSTHLEELKQKNPDLAEELALVGSQPDWALRNMIKALQMLPFLNTDEDNKRLAAAKKVLRLRRW